MGWVYIELGDVCEFMDRRGVTPKKLGSDFLSSGFRVISAKNIKGRDVVTDVGEQRYVDEATYQKWMKSPLIQDDVLLTSEAPLGEPAYISEQLEWCLGQRLFGLRTDKSRLYGRFLFHALQSELIRKDLFSRATGATAQGIRQSELQKVLIPLPPIPEQKRIVAILDQAFTDIDKARALTEQNLKNARELFESYLQQVFSQRGEGWVNSTVGDQLTLQRGFDITKKQQRPGVVPVVSSGGIKSFHDEYKVEGPGVVIGRKGSLGTVFYVEENFWPHDTTLWVKDFKGNHPKLVYYFFRGLEVKKLDSGAANPALNRNMVHPLKVSWPEKSRQAGCVTALDSLSEKIAEIEGLYLRKAEVLGDLKKSLLQQAFSGALTNSSAEVAA